MTPYFDRMAFAWHGQGTRGRTAFTLIEILVVVAIIALLLAILIPALAHARKLSEKSVCASQLRELGHATEAYKGVHQGSLPGPIHPAVELATDEKVAAQDHEDWHLPSFLRKYFTDKSKGGKATDEIGQCPTALQISKNRLKNQFSKTDYRRPFTYAINNWNEDYSTQIEFGTNPPWYFGWPDYFWANDSPPFKRRDPETEQNLVKRRLFLDSASKKSSAVRHPSLEWCYGDAFRYPEDNRPTLTTGRPSGQWRVGTYQFDFVHDNGLMLIPDQPYHIGGINVIFFDGHAEFQRDWRGTVNPQE